MIMQSCARCKQNKYNVRNVRDDDIEIRLLSTYPELCSIDENLPLKICQDCINELEPSFLQPAPVARAQSQSQSQRSPDSSNVIAEMAGISLSSQGPTSSTVLTERAQNQSNESNESVVSHRESFSENVVLSQQQVESMMPNNPQVQQELLKVSKTAMPQFVKKKKMEEIIRRAQNQPPENVVVDQETVSNGFENFLARKVKTRKRRHGSKSSNSNSNITSQDVQSRSNSSISTSSQNSNIVANEASQSQSLTQTSPPTNVVVPPKKPSLRQPLNQHIISNEATTSRIPLNQRHVHFDTQRPITRILDPSPDSSASSNQQDSIRQQVPSIAPPSASQRAPKQKDSTNDHSNMAAPRRMHYVTPSTGSTAQRGNTKFPGG